jgi:hypothetical protein
MVDWDVAKDFLVFCRNDKDFYPSHFFPCMSTLSDLMDLKKPIKRSHCMPMIKKGMREYCDRYKLGSPNDIFDEKIVDQIFEVIKTEEFPLIRKGEYRCR